MSVARRRERVLLLSLPWRLASWPSLAIASLKAHLIRSGFECDAQHFHLTISWLLGDRLYEKVALGWELGEAIYGSLLFPEERPRLMHNAARALRQAGQNDLADWALGTACEDVSRATEACIGQVDVDRYRLVGLSVGALQLLSSLYVAHRLKRADPRLTIVLGGAGVVGSPGRHLLENFPELDVVVDGEGEAAIEQLARLPSSYTETELGQIPNLWYRNHSGASVKSYSSVHSCLDSLAIPNFDEYYETARRLEYPRSALVLPLEGSRGCSWEHRCGDDNLRGCTFCGLYRTSPNYREKSIHRIREEIGAAVSRYRVLDLSFVDAYLPDKHRQELLQWIAASHADLTIFCEMRCNLNEQTAANLADAPARRVQLGVEAFSTPILVTLQKGTRTIDNISSLKLCEEYGIPYQYNLITHIPGISAIDIEQMIALLPTLYGFRPPNLARFYLDRGSRMFQAPFEHGIEPSSLDETVADFIPECIANNQIMQSVGFRQTSNECDNAWERLIQNVGVWIERHARARAMGLLSPLTYRDGGEFLTITDCRETEIRIMTLERALRDVFLACTRTISMRALKDQLGHFTRSDLEEAIAEMVSQRVLFREASQVVALPIHCASPNERLPAVPGTIRSPKVYR